MPRKPRMYIAGLPCHIIQRGNNRGACFFSDQDYRFYLSCLADACKRYYVAVHAYVLMTNHVHLLMTPEREGGISRVMQSLGRRYVQYVNLSYRRSGTLWEGRHKATLIQAENYLLTCYRYIELNPVRANMVNQPGDYRWSSYHCNAYGAPDPLVMPHEIYQSLAAAPRERQHCYRGLFDAMLDKHIIQAIRTAVNYSMPLGTSRFVAEIEAALGRSVGHGRRGRPKCEGNGVCQHSCRLNLRSFV